jgi:hypothetical protein
VRCAGGWYFELTASKTLRSFAFTTSDLGNGDEVLRHVSNLPLEGVFVEGDISNKGVMNLAKCKALKEIVIASDRVTSEGIRSLSQIL